MHRLVRFISDLVNVRVANTKSILNIYEKFIDLTNEANSPQVCYIYVKLVFFCFRFFKLEFNLKVRTDFYVYCVLSSIPWNGKLLYEKHGPEFDEILESIKIYIG